ncbi:5-formyltetrahydrofolate cyclo-ligase [Albirhodobacter sp. R86504]|jgi:5-formyltetrahydrofolate cyclo-ligase|uniref:5-formyltetrahydrofolate cyclo-ligase n=1 Tax=Albirhodobacter sp. R86504 TaxID=3093848 RepID=UPI00366AA440
MDILEQKAEARALCRAARKAAHAEAGGHSTAALGHLSNILSAFSGKVLAGYMPIHSEIDPLAAMAAHDGPVCVPVIEAEGRPLKFQLWTPDCDMVEGAFGAMIPAQGPYLEPQAVIVPMLGFDERGFRLGYGGGFYDRTLERLRRLGPVTAIGFAYAAQELEAVPVEDTDEPLDLVVTDRGVLFPEA